MGFRFRRSLRIVPGIRLNFGKRGVSTSIGIRGVHVTLGHGKVRETAGIPGSGISYTHVSGTPEDAHSTAPSAEAPEGRSWRAWVWIGLLVAVVLGFMASGRF